MTDTRNPASPATPERGVIGIVGAGKSGTAIARLALDAGYTVRIASSGNVGDLKTMMSFIAPGAATTEVSEVAFGADLVILAVPLRRFQDLPSTVFEGRIVIDVMNYWPPIDGILPAFEGTDVASSAVVRDTLPASAAVVKTFNHLGYHQMEDLARPEGAHDRVALGIAGDNDAAVAAVMSFVNATGFDPVAAGPLDHSQPLQPETPVFGSALDRNALTDLLARQAQTA